MLSYLFPFDSEKEFQITWIGWAFTFFFIASLFGLLMRAFHLVEVPWLAYKNILHTHSHIALLGWGFLMLNAGIVFSLIRKKEINKGYGWLFIGGVIAVIGMLFSFPFQGYGLISISFSTLQILVSYGFAAKLLKAIQLLEKTPGVRLIRWAILSMVISSLGLWALGPISSSLGRMHELYFMSIQWFLHFQLNGWFVFGVLGLVVLFFENRGLTIKWSVWQEIILVISLVFTYALVITWANPSPTAFAINGLAVILQLLAYLLIITPLFGFVSKSGISKLAKTLLFFALISLFIKGLLQAILVLPAVAVMSYTIRMYVIGFLHLVLLGIMTLGLGGVAIAREWIDESRVLKSGWLFILIAFVSSESLLFLQGTLIWARLGFLSDYHLWLFLASCLFPIGILFILRAVIIQKIKSVTHSNSKISIQNNSKIKTMKKSLILSIGILGIFMTSCGGGGTSESSATTETVTANETPAASPSGIGEIKSVDLGTGIDAKLAEAGLAIVDMKCTACHQLNDKRLVGPGFQGVTNRRRPEWIMNMITNVDVMLDQDPTAQKLLEECLTRMPNQNITQADARGVLEYLRQNDETKAGVRDAAVK